MDNYDRYSVFKINDGVQFFIAQRRLGWSDIRDYMEKGIYVFAKQKIYEWKYMDFQSRYLN